MKWENVRLKYLHWMVDGFAPIAIFRRMFDFCTENRRDSCRHLCFARKRVNYHTTLRGSPG